MVNGEIYIQKVSATNVDSLFNFLNSAGESLKTFRYFEKRPITVISNHILTALIFLNNEPVS
jgi:hypothetical protein